MKVDFNELNISEDLETEGFDLDAGQTWIYPTNYPIRDYQYNIIQQALFKNTLVSLPTGLGKTFIAAVVMYNFFRWYPLGKIIFMAPTRPLVKQQIEACYDVMAIPKDATVELTGTKLSSSREDVWKDKRVFFITPQILQNDMDKLVGLHKKIKCLVFDEAHRARGNHAYCEVIRKLVPHSKYFRVLALSATPGTTVSDVLEVARNLLISHLEFRTEESLDVRPYVFERNLTTVVVPLGEKLQQIRNDYLQVLEHYTRLLVKFKVIEGNCGNLTKGKIFMTLKEYQQKSGLPNYGEIMKSLNICITLYHGFELLVRHGLRSFLSFFDEHMNKPLLRGNIHLIQIMDDIRQYVGPDPVVDQLPDGSFSEIPENCKFGHPKFYKLQDILVSHFLDKEDSSRAIVFFEYRNSVMEAHALLNRARPLLKPKIFLGQGRGVTQRQQLNVVKAFKEGQCNILLSTCIGEEGLDVGDVDLIVCFDISNKSPIRMVQRMGRTGRKREGRITVLVTEGKEQQILKDCLMCKNNIAAQVLSSKELVKGLNADSPRLVPAEITPHCDKMYITVKKPSLSKKCSIKDMFSNISSKSPQLNFSPDLEIVCIKNRIPELKNLWDKGNPFDENLLVSNMFAKKIEKQRTLHSIHTVKHSANTKLLVSLLQQVDSKRFNIPATQIGCPSQFVQSRNLKQCNLKNMFLIPHGSIDSLLRTQETQKSSQGNLTEENLPFCTKKLMTEVSNYLTINISDRKAKCKHCPSDIDCTICDITPGKVPTWTQHDEPVFNMITLEDLNIFFEQLITKSNGKSDYNPEFIQNSCFTQRELNQLGVDTRKTINSTNAHLKSHNINNIAHSKTTMKDKCKEKSTKQVYTSSEVTNLLNLFKLNSIKDLFEFNTSNEFQETFICSPDIIETSFIDKTKSDSNETHKPENPHSLSPVLCRFERVKNIRNSQRKLFSELQTEQKVDNVQRPEKSTKPNLKKLKIHNLSESNVKIDTPTKFISQAFGSTSTPLCSKTQEKYSNEHCEASSSRKENEHNVNAMDIDDLCDLSIFGISTTKNLTENLNRTENLSSGVDKRYSAENIEDMCDLKMFGIENETTNGLEAKKSGTNTEIEKNEHKTSYSVNDSFCTKPNVSNPERFSSKDFLTSNKSVASASQSQMSVTQMIHFINRDKCEERSSFFENENLTISKTKNVVNKTENKELFLRPNNIEKTLKSDTFMQNHSEINKKWNVPTSVVKFNSVGNSMARKKKRIINPFIENEAELSLDENLNISEDEEDENQNFYEESFIDDCSQRMDTQMHVKYLQSVRSPRNHSKFKIPQRPTYNSNIYSQEVSKDDTYLDDSFVVDDEVEEEHELSELEILEKKLEQNRKKKRSRYEDNPKSVKRKRIKHVLSDDSD